MPLIIDAEIQELIVFIQKAQKPGQQVYLVGGAVRDILLGCQLKDLDFVLAENPVNLAKKISRHLNAGFFVLDDERQTVRIMYYLPNGQLFPLDFVKFTGENLMADLFNRDFTINAMAVSIRDLDTLIDPINGENDLRQGRLRTCNIQSLLDDPVRVIRGIRLARQFGLDYADGLEKMMVEAAEKLPQVSTERLRDEFFRILQGSDPVKGLRDCRRLNVLESLLPPLADSQAYTKKTVKNKNTVAIVDSFYQLFRLFNNSDDNSIAISDRTLTIHSALDKYKYQIKEYFSNELTPGRSILGLSVSGSLLYDYSQGDLDRKKLPFVIKFGKHLRLSNTEMSWLQNFMAGLHDFQTLTQDKNHLARNDVYRFYKISGDAGVAAVFLKIAEALARPVNEINDETFVKFLDHMKSLLIAWWDQYDQVVKPDLLLNGNALQQVFNLTPGKEIGRLLSCLEEAQASGNVSTREEAVRFLEEKVKHMITRGTKS